jgi:hypothetical protein
VEQVAVVAVLQRPGGLYRNGEHLSPRPAAGSEKLHAVRTVDQFGGDERVSGVDAAVEVLGDVGVVEALEGEHLAGELLDEGGIAGQRLGQDFHRGAPGGIVVASGGVHRAERSASDLRFQEPVTDAGPDHAVQYRCAADCGYPEDSVKFGHSACRYFRHMPYLRHAPGSFGESPMRSMLLLGFVVAGAAGCESTRHSTVNCVPCKTHKTSCPVTPTPAFAPSTAPAKPVTLPPSIKEVRGEDSEPRQFASAPSTTTSTSLSFIPPPAPVAAPAPSFVPQPAPVPAATSFIPPPAPLPVNAATPPVVTQGDVLLIPRWVYVPYSPHTPNGPTKLPANIAGPQHTGPYVQTESGMTVLPQMGAAPAAAMSAQQMAMMEQWVQQMKMMNQRMSELEAKAAARPATPASATIPVITTTSPQMLPLPPPLTVPMIPPAK